MSQLILKIKDKLRNPIRTKLLYFYKLKNIRFRFDNKKQIIICMDGFTQHGGLVDRVKGIISIFETAKKTGFEFKIYHKSPYQLTDFLEPNHYNWIATDDDVKWNPLTDVFHYKMLDENFNPIAYFSKTNKKKHLIYANMNYLASIFPDKNIDELNKIWATSFNELFKKSEYLTAALEKLNLPEKKITIHSRFCSILGDFVDTVETSFLSQDEQIKLFTDLINATKTITKTYDENGIYVFSDSIIYLNYIKKNTNYQVLDGEPIHPDNLDQIFSKEQHLKTILDFFVIASCDEIFLVRKNFMYPSAYTKFASYLYQKPFKEIVTP